MRSNWRACSLEPTFTEMWIWTHLFQIFVWQTWTLSFRKAEQLVQSQRARSRQSQESSKHGYPNAGSFSFQKDPCRGRGCSRKALDPRAVWSGCFPPTPAPTQQTETVFHHPLSGIISSDVRGLWFFVQIPYWKPKTGCKRSNVSSVRRFPIWGPEGRNNGLSSTEAKTVGHPSSLLLEKE